MHELTTLPGWKELVTFASTRKMPFFLVGGAVRDLLMGRAIRDIDILLPAKAKQESLRFGRKYSFPTFPLHDEIGIHRVVPQKGFYIDFAEFQGNTLEEDLRQRDFSINALALNVLDIQENSKRAHLEEKVIDCSEGLRDLQEKRLSVIGDDTIINDPLRLVRAFRFYSQLDFPLSEKTHYFVMKQGELISSVAHERIYQELALLFFYNHRPAMTLFVNSGLWQRIIEYTLDKNTPIQPGSLRKSLGRWFFHLQILEELQKKEHQAGIYLKTQFDQKLSGNITLGSLFSLFCLLPDDISDRKLEKFGRSLTLSKQAIMVLRRWSAAGNVLRSTVLHRNFGTRSNIRSLLFHYQDALIPSLIFVFSSPEVNVSMTYGLDLLCFSIDEWTGTRKEQNELIAKVDGHLISEVTQVKPSALLGRILQQTHEKIYLDELENYEEVLHFLRSNNSW